MPQNLIPSSTYRLQMLGHVRFQEVMRIVQYLDDLGVGALYLAPFFRARNKSTHGYDIVDHSRCDPSLGTEADFQALAEELRTRGLGLVVDVVPNHMSIDDSHNAWWRDVLENGEASHFASFFDIDWAPPKAELHGKILLAVLGDQFGKALEDQQINLVFEDQHFIIRYYDKSFPTDPQSWVAPLALTLERLGATLAENHPQRMELESVITELEHLPSRSAGACDVIQHRHREKEVARRRLSALLQASPEIREALASALDEFNGVRGEPSSFDRLEKFLHAQAYRLCYWRVATDEINYRRFFDVDSLAAIRVEDPEVFEAVHQYVLAAVAAGQITGLRIDHADGLLDPQQYLATLAKRASEAATRSGAPATAVAATISNNGFSQSDAPIGDDSPGDEPSPMSDNAVAPYLVVEKILSRDETLPSDWPVQGTTGYNFLNFLNGLFVDRQGYSTLRDVYTRFTGQSETFSRVVYGSKKTILATSLSSELFVLANQLARIAEQHRWSRDFTHSSLYRALREVVSCFPVYRTYVRPGSDVVSDDDKRRVREAVRIAKRRNPAMSPSFFDFIASVLLLDDPDGLADNDRAVRRRFVLKFQQVTGPITAKGLEDTTFYRYFPLASLNEVGGGDPALAALSIERMHRTLEDRKQAWPHEMSATATHDTKRGEDLRARLNVLSETPETWTSAIHRWQTLNAPARRVIDEADAPDANEEYLFYQTIVGAWPLETLDDEAWQSWVERICQYLEKALREAKLHTSWLNPDREYESAVLDFARAALADRKSTFVEDLDKFVRSIASAGFVNSLAQTVIKLFAPGVPDFYQGVEFWDFSLVDPDNRRPVDFDRRAQRLSELSAAATDGLPELAERLLSDWPDERLKLLVTWRGLRFRREHPELIDGDYQPLVVSGARAGNTFAFARIAWPQWLVVVTPRLALAAWRDSASPENVDRSPPPNALAASDSPSASPWRPAAWWEDSRIELPEDAPRKWKHLFTGEPIAISPRGEAGLTLELGALFGRFPVAVLVSDSN